MIRYEIYQRQSDQHRTGHFGLLIEGVEAELTVEPKQFMERALREAAAAGKTGGELATAAESLCNQYARKALERRIERLQFGTVPEGVNVGSFLTGGINAGTAGEMARRKLVPEARAVELFLNRGSLKGLDKEQRKKRRAARKNAFDNERDWQERRAKLIQECEAELARWEAAAKAWLELPEDERRRTLPPKAVKRAAELRDRLRGLMPKALAASHGFQYAYTQYLTKAVSLSADDIRIWPLMTNTTLDTVRDAVDQFSDVTADEFDGSNYSSGGLALDSQAVAVDDANDRAEFDAADETVTALGAGTRPIQGVALGSFVTNTAASLPLHWIEFASNKTPDGSDFTFVFNAEGILQATDG